MYYNNRSAPCRAGDFSLTRPYQGSDGRNYYCVGDLGPTEYTAVSKMPSGTCPAQFAVADAGSFGRLCLNKIDNNKLTLRPSVNIPTDCKESPVTKENCGIVKYLFLLINTLSALVGIVVIGMIIIGGIEWSASNDNPQRVAAARSKIVNAVLALLVFIFTYAFLQWVVPGGIF